MFRRRQLIGVLVVVAIILAASVIYVFFKPTPQPSISISEQMALTSGEIEPLGPGWTNDTTRIQGQGDVSLTWLVNDSYEAIVYLTVYDNIPECKQWFENYSGQWGQNITLLNITLGDEAFLAYYGNADEPYVDLVFTKENIRCQILAPPAIYVGKPWWVDTTILIAQLQLEKIDSYLAR
jgi:hypothetical protein